MSTINIGLSEAQRASAMVLLNQVLANVALLQIKTRKMHWDVTGPQFRSLHELWDEQYQALAREVDDLAERVRYLGGFPLATAAGWQQHAEIAEHPGEVSSATAAVQELQEDHELVVRSLRAHIDAAQKLRDRGTEDFFTQLLRAHERMAWMLRAYSEGEAVESSGRVVEGPTPQLA